MDLGFLLEMYIPLVIAACLVIGYILKMWLPMDNKFIPTLLTILGAVLACVINKETSAMTIIAGAISGLASTGLHQAFKQLLNLGKDGEK